MIGRRGVIMDDRLIEAAREAARTGLLRRRDAQRVLSGLGATACGRGVVPLRWRGYPWSREAAAGLTRLTHELGRRHIPNIHKSPANLMLCAFGGLV